MVFSSIQFIFIFLPIFFLVYYLLPFKFKNIWLFIASLVFYSYGVLEEPLYILLIVVSILLNYFIGLAISRSEKRKSLWLTAGLAYNFAWLFLFKYSDFIFENINAFFGEFFLFFLRGFFQFGVGVYFAGPFPEFKLPVFVHEREKFLLAHIKP